MFRMQQHSESPGEHRKALLESLYLRYAPALLAFLLKQTSAREDAEDLLLEVFRAALEHKRLEQLSGEEQRLWLWRIARHKLIDAYRRASRRTSVSMDLMLNDLFAHDEQMPEYAALRGEEFSRLHAALQTLPQLQQRILKLRFVNGLRSTEIASLVGKSDTAVRSLLSRTLNQLRTFYGERG
jgi:RNA polymerase sigma factor (sigma-70 family)